MLVKWTSGILKLNTAILIQENEFENMSSVKTLTSGPARCGFCWSHVIMRTEFAIQSRVLHYTDGLLQGLVAKVNK